jgi:hypothetical protein
VVGGAVVGGAVLGWAEGDTMSSVADASSDRGLRTAALTATTLK